MKLLVLLPFIILMGLITACSTTRVTEQPQENQLTATGTQENTVSVVRYGRYTLIELMPTKNQTHLLKQVIDVTIPNNIDKPYTSVGDAINYILIHSGYQLCAQSALTKHFNTLPLPAAHIRLGPLTLQDSLSTLVGAGWKLEVEESKRQVCFRTAKEEPIINVDQEMTQ